MAKDRVRLSKVFFSSYFIIRRCLSSKWQIPTRLSPGCWDTMLRKRALSFLRADSCLSRRCSNTKGAISVLKPESEKEWGDMDFFLSNTFQGFELEAIHWKMSRLLWLNVLSKDFPSKRTERWVENIVLKIVETFFCPGSLAHPG